ncbi:MAG: rod shape-determining protein RodA [Nitrospirae bacterium]|nr:rod shape-determining protein RodA [Nitrospirota bacterium]
MNPRRILSPFDWQTFFVLLLILGTGVLTIYSATFLPAHTSLRSVTPVYAKQLLWIALGMAAFWTAVFVDYRFFLRYAYGIYGASVFLVVLVVFFGKEGFGAQRWLDLGIVSFQPSELAKVALVVFCARYFSDYPSAEGYTLSKLLVPGLLVAVPMVLVLKQPDLGTALVFLFAFSVVLFLIRIRSKFLALLSVLSLMLFPFLWQAFWGQLEGYQKNRLLTYVNPDLDPTGAGYHLLQSKIAIGSGGFWGKGLLESTQSQLNFLPARHTDFIFAVFAEEWGFLGALLLLALYAYIVAWGVDVAYKAPDRATALLASGLVAIFFFYCMINIGMTLGLFPVVGIPLPLMSYGGTSMIMTLFSLGILFNIKRRRYMFY